MEHDDKGVFGGQCNVCNDYDDFIVEDGSVKCAL